MINGKNKLAALDVIEAGHGAIIGDDVMKTLRAAGYVEARPVQTGKRGRPSLTFHVTSKANSFRNVASRWNK